MSEAFERAREASDLLRAVASLKGDELGDPSDVAVLRASAKAHMKALQAAGESFPCPALGGSVQVRTKGINKIISTSADERKLQIIPVLRELFASAVEFKPKGAPYNAAADKSAREYHYLRAAVSIAGTDVLVRIVIKEDVNGQFHYDHTIHPADGILDSAGQKETPRRTEASLALLPMMGERNPSHLASAQLVASVAKAGGLVNFMVEMPSTGLLDSLAPLARIRAASALAAKAAEYRGAASLPTLERLRLARDLRGIARHP